MPHSSLYSDLLQYIVERDLQPGDRLPTITELSRELGVSVSKIREELEVARALGLVQVKPRLGTQVREFDFGPAATLGVLYAVGLNRSFFHDFVQLRNSVEISFWHEAVCQLTQDDIEHLRQLVVQALDKLNQVPVVVPFEEHRNLHLTFFKYLENPFVQGILNAYWTAYKAFGLSLHADLSYHHRVWEYHAQMVECVARGNYEDGLTALREHMALLRYRPVEESVVDAQPDDPQDDPQEEETKPIYHFFE